VSDQQQPTSNRDVFTVIAIATLATLLIGIGFGLKQWQMYPKQVQAEVPSMPTAKPAGPVQPDKKKTPPRTPRPAVTTPAESTEPATAKGGGAENP